ncbi:MAG: type IV toxin-antitoxin system AbiEi family antitoxin domain-containing protein [Jatrophihabitans sp.]
MHSRFPDLPRVLTAQGAAEHGWSREAVRHAVGTGRWQRLARGIYLTNAHGVARDDWILVGMALSGPRAALSGWDALRIVGIGAPTAPTPRVLVLDRAGANRSLDGVQVRPTSRPFASRFLPVSHPTLPLIPVVAAARAVADTALLYRSPKSVRALVTTAIQRKVCTPAELATELVACPRARSAPLRRALEDVLDGARSIAEAEAVDFLRTARVPPFELNVPIIDATGRTIAVADALWRELRAVLEIDSQEFHFGAEDWKATTTRHNQLTMRGLALAHYPPSEIRARRGEWGAEVAAWLRNRAEELGARYLPARGPVRAVGTPLPFRVS